jgi:hypothetical protein
MKKQLFPALFGSCILLSAATVQAADSVVADCSAGDTNAVISMAATGAGTLQGNSGEDSFSCDLKLAVLEGPPFSESMTGMLILTFDREQCQPRAVNRKLMSDISLHIEEPMGTPVSGMTMINRRPVLFECRIVGFDLAAVRKLTEQQSGIRIHSEQ